MAWSQDEFRLKLDRVRRFINREGIKNLLIKSQAGFTWLTGGRPFINRAADIACGYLLVTDQKVYLVASNIEAGRLIVEELDGLPVTKVEYPWWDPTAMDAVINDLCGDDLLFNDLELGSKFSRLRWDLIPEELFRFSRVGGMVAQTLEKVAFAVTPGDSEEKVAALLNQAAISFGLTLPVVLAAADDRIYQYRHPLPTGKVIDKYFLMSICGQKYGLVASASRLVHFGKASRELRRRHEAVAKVDSVLIGATKPGQKVKDILAAGIRAYEETGFPGEWKNHHQGGLAGYSSREFRATPESEETVAEGQAYAWNPTVAGAKSEDTILAGRDGPRVITVSQHFPRKTVEYRGFTVERPDILER